MTDKEVQGSPFVDDPSIYNKKLETVPKPQKKFGVDTDQTLLYDISAVDSASSIDMSEIDKFTNISDNRNELYSLIDQMGADSRIAAILEIYAEDSTERNQQGKIVWAESEDGDIVKYINFLLKSLNIDKNIYKWVYSLCKYGDLYVRLFRESDVEDTLFEDSKDEKQKLNEDIKIKVYPKKDKYVHYVEMVPNPAEMFELTKFGSTYAYIQAPSTVAADYDYTGEEAWLTNAQNRYLYKFKKNDIYIYQPTEFVHACLEDSPTRFPEQVQIFNADSETEADADATTKLSYSVRRGSSLLSNIFKIWRELMLLENSVLLNRITKSSIVRVIQVEVGDMPKENVKPHIYSIKNMIEQKSAISEGKKLSEYTNPGPIENNIYVPTRNGQGVLTTSQIGGDVDVKSLVDLDYFSDKLYGALRVPKQYLGQTDDSTGFNGGTALSLISASFAKMVKRIQATITQMITDLINILLYSKDQAQYIGKFTIQMVEPMTEEDKNRQENLSSEIQVVSDTMNLLGDIEDPITKLKILKALVSNVITNEEVIDLLEEEIQRLEKEGQTAEAGEGGGEGGTDIDIDLNSGGGGGGFEEEPLGDLNTEMSGTEETGTEEVGGGEETAGELPSMNDIGLDFADSSQF